MAYNLLSCDRDQGYLMPPSLRDWLGEGHLAWFILDAVEQTNLDEFYAAYRNDGWGAAAYDPGMMVAVLLYAYCQGLRSSRRIARALEEDVGFRVVAANQQPDFRTLCRFRAEHEERLKRLFVEVLRLCREAGLVKLGVSLDGTSSGQRGPSQPSHEAIEEEVRFWRRRRRWTRKRTPLVRPAGRVAGRPGRRAERLSAEASAPGGEAAEAARAAREAGNERQRDSHGKKKRGLSQGWSRPFGEAKANTTDPTAAS